MTKKKIKQKQTIEAKARVLSKEQEQEMKFVAAIAADNDKWKHWPSKVKFFDFMKYCLKKGNKKWIQKIAEHAREDMREQGMVNNPIMGWCYPKELELAGVRKVKGKWTVTDLEKFSLFFEMKKEKSMEEGRKEFVAKRREQHEKERNEYLDALVNSGEEPWT